MNITVTSGSTIRPLSHRMDSVLISGGSAHRSPADKAELMDDRSVSPQFYEDRPRSAQSVVGCKRTPLSNYTRLPSGPICINGREQIPFLFFFFEQTESNLEVGRCKRNGQIYLQPPVLRRWMDQLIDPPEKLMCERGPFLLRQNSFTGMTCISLHRSKAEKKKKFFSPYISI